MRTNLILAALLMALPLGMMGQSREDAFISKKKKTVTTYDASRGQFNTEVDATDDQPIAPDYHVGTLRSDDEYNRRGHYARQYGEVCVGNDTLYMTNDTLYLDEQVQANAYDEGFDDGYNYSQRLVRFRGGLRSPYYWDMYYDWTYDPWFYDPWYYGPGFYGWYGPYYSPWYRHGWYGWYDPWYDPWYYGHGHWGVHYHHNYAYNGGSRYGGRRSSSMGISSGRGTRGNSFSGGRGTRVGNTTYAGRNDGTMGSSSRGSRVLQQGSSSRGTTSRVTTPQTGSRVTTTQPSYNTSSSRGSRSVPTTSSSSYSAPTRSSSSSFGGGGFGGGSFVGGRSGGGFGGGGSSSRGGRR